MFEIDKANFGRFLSAQRKENGFTQKELAQKLFISDKAVSKWERGLSLPDITLLMPLAELLGITVTELLEGRLIDSSAELDAAQIESLVKKALVYPEKLPEKTQKLKRKHRLVFGLCTLVVFSEWAVLLAACGSFSLLVQNDIFQGASIVQVLSLCFGAHFWLQAKEQLPSYYDENKISGYQCGMFELNLPGICLNNRNWRHILRVGRIWSVLGATAFPFCHFILYFVIRTVAPDQWIWHLVLNLCLPLFFCLDGLLLPMYYVGRKYA